MIDLCVATQFVLFIKGCETHWQHVHSDIGCTPEYSLLFLYHFCWQAAVLVTHIYIWNLVKILCHLTLSKTPRVLFPTTVQPSLWLRTESHACLCESLKNVKWIGII